MVIFITPITEASFDEIEIFEEERTRQRAIELQNSLSEKDKFEVIKLYKEKLNKKIEESIKAIDIQSKIEVKTEVEKTKMEKFGDINKVTIIVHGDLEEKKYNDIKNILYKEFEVENKKMRIIELHNEG